MSSLAVLMLFFCLMSIQEQGVSSPKTQSIPAPPKTESKFPTQWVDSLSNKYVVYSDITYLRANNYEVKLDVFQPTGVNSPGPTVIFFHGGGWVEGSRSASVLHVLPYLQMGMTVVNVDYRLANVSLAPAAVEDCRCALKWVVTNSKQYMFDTNRIILTGRSAGGHLALTTGLLSSSDGFDWRCYLDEQPMELKVAAIINWYGVTDVSDVLDGPNWRPWAANWLGSIPQRMEIAKKISPINYIRKGIPPIITIHGDKDPVVPYSQAVTLHKLLNQAGVPNQLFTVRGGGHSGFSEEEMYESFSAIRLFLTQHVPGFSEAHE